MIIIPAILTNDSGSFQEQIVRLAPYYHHFSIDIIDGKLYPNTTLTLEETIRQLHTLPSDIRTRCVFDFDCMVQDTDGVFRYFITHTLHVHTGVVFFHKKADPSPHVFEHRTIRFGLALAPNDSVEITLKTYHKHLLSAIQIMSVEPGFQGSPFQMDTLKKIEQLREAHYKSYIYTDGAMNNETVGLLQKLNYKPDYVCVGSYLSKSGDRLPDAIATLERVISSPQEHVSEPAGELKIS